jgi:hypothetical protein
MKTKENVTLYICEHCNRKMQIKNAMIKHEEICSKNPKNVSACSGCIFMEEGETNVYYYHPYNGEETVRKCKTFHCKKLNKDLYPYKVVRKGLLSEYPESFEGMEQMPNKCEHWNYTEEPSVGFLKTFG